MSRARLLDVAPKALAESETSRDVAGMARSQGDPGRSATPTTLHFDRSTIANGAVRWTRRVRHIVAVCAHVAGNTTQRLDGLLIMKYTVPLASALLVVCNSCAVFRSAQLWDSIEAVCESSLVNTLEVQAKANSLKISPSEVACALCKIADVIEPFARQQMSTATDRTPEQTATEQAIEIAKSKGLL